MTRSQKGGGKRREVKTSKAMKFHKKKSPLTYKKEKGNTTHCLINREGDLGAGKGHLEARPGKNCLESETATFEGIGGANLARGGGRGKNGNITRYSVRGRRGVTMKKRRGRPVLWTNWRWRIAKTTGPACYKAHLGILEEDMGGREREEQGSTLIDEESPSH